MLRIKHERLRRHWSQTALAFHARMSVGDVGRIESGRLRPYDSQLEKLAAVLDLSTDALLQEVSADQAETVQRSASPESGRLVAAGAA